MLSQILNLMRKERKISLGYLSKLSGVKENELLLILNDLISRGYLRKGIENNSQQSNNCNTCSCSSCDCGTPEKQEPVVFYQIVEDKSQ